MALGGASRSMAGVCSVLLLLGAVCMLGGGIHTYNLDPNKAHWPTPTSDGMPTLTGGGGSGSYSFSNDPANGQNWAATFGNAFSCDGRANSMWHNTSYATSNRCIVRPSYLTGVDAKGDGSQGDESGFIYPGALDEAICGEYIEPQGSDTCMPPFNGPNRCPDNALERFHPNKVYAKSLYETCKSNQPGRDLFIGNGVVLLVLALCWLYYVRLESQDSPTASAVGPWLVSMSSFALAMTAASAYLFFSSSPAALVAYNKLRCDLMTDLEYFSGSGSIIARGADMCRVENGTCDPTDFSNRYFPSSSEIGECKYVNPANLQVKCSEIRATDPQDNKCEEVDCQYTSEPFGESYKSDCCQKRRLCCGDNAVCSPSSVCAWRNSTYPVAEGGDQQNQCYNRLEKEDSEACNDAQWTAFNKRLLVNGRCWNGNSFRLSSFNAQDFNGDGSGATAECSRDRKEALYTAADYYFANTEFIDENLRVVTGDYLRNNVPSCLMRHIYGNCRTACWGTGQATCPTISPYQYMDEEDNRCVWSTDLSGCVPDKARFDTPEKQAARPAEYCESLNDAATEEERITACEAGGDLCAWTRVSGSKRCAARSCPGYSTNNGYQTSNGGAPCTVSTTADPAKDPNFRICANSTFGCTPSQNSAYCSVWTAADDANYYYGASSNNFNPGQTLYQHALCPLYASEANCTTTNNACAWVGGAEGGQVCVAVARVQRGWLCLRSICGRSGSAG